MGAVGAIEVTSAHTTILETGARSCTGKGRCGRAFQRALCFRWRRERRVWRLPQTGNLCDAYSLPRNQKCSRCCGLVFMAHLRMS